MSNEQRFNTTHQWAKRINETQVSVGISQHAEDALGDIVYVELPELGKEVVAGEVLAGIESVKTASDIQSPVSGKLIACNTDLEDTPEVLNEAPLLTWIFVLEADADQLDKEWQTLLDTAAYEVLLASL
ncbi:glycine cleavage system protein GcvH [Marinospirillum insulare]|uniref:Glycine cleavage system H protein n=1 Tax=Marinospirillum insulare TaxID=217169 RepID=A0ABQ5ZXP1_9GAMM|nr:glycine cleavage system protein GcvH [Marinospirillum insulare]GLR63838.1 glycine cleavage system H protein 2 [Marinospirillum insulare]